MLARIFCIEGEWLGGSPDAEWGNNENISLEEESE
jgi:hypothetical protein